MVRLVLVLLFLLSRFACANPAICRVWMDDGSVGTGFAIGHFRDGGSAVLTNDHVVADSSSGRGHVVFYGDGQQYAATVARTVEPRAGGDIALLRTTRRGGAWIAVDSRPVSRTEPLGWQGFAGGELELSDVVGIMRPGGPKHAWLTARRGALAGESGSPVLDASGKAVGIVWGTSGNEAAWTPFVATRLTQCFIGNCPPVPRPIARPVQPIPGKPGATGPAGRGIANAEIIGGNLVLTYTDGTTQDVGRVVGQDGAATALPGVDIVFHDEASWAASGASNSVQHVDLAADKPTIHLPPNHVQVWDQHGSSEPILDLESGEKEAFSRIGDPIKIVNRLPE